MNGQVKSKPTSQFTVSTSRISWKRVPGHKYQWSLQQCRETQSRTTFCASMHDIHKIYTIVKMASTNTWIDGKQWRRRRRTSYNSAKH
eukprot:5245814-Amphidinium_carterae.1